VLVRLTLLLALPALLLAGPFDWSSAAHLTISFETPVTGYMVLRDVCRFSKPVSIIAPLGMTFAAGMVKDFVLDDYPDPWDIGCNFVALTVAGVILWKFGK